MSSSKRKAEIILVGAGPLVGQGAFSGWDALCDALQQQGIAAAGLQAVSGSEVEILTALRAAVGRSSVIVLLSGVGPIRCIICRALGMPLAEDGALLTQLSAGQQPTELQRVCSLLPEGGIPLPEESGASAGLCLCRGGQAILLLPAVRESALEMLMQALPQLEQQLGLPAVCRRTLRLCGVTAEELAARLHLPKQQNPALTIREGVGELLLDISASAEDADAAALLADNSAAQLHQLLGDKVYSDDGLSLPETVVRLLLRSGKTAAVAESCTGGMMAAAITDIPGSSAAFEYGVASYADWVKCSALDVDRSLLKRHSAISSVVAGEMARGARRNGRASYGVGITGVAGPGHGSYLDKPVGLVYIAVCDRKTTLVQEFFFGEEKSRDEIRTLAMMAAFEMLRRLHLQLPLPAAVQFGPRQITDIARKRNPKTKLGLAAKKALILVLCTGITLFASLFAMQAVVAADNRGSYLRMAREFSLQDAEADGFAVLLEQNRDTAGWLQGAGGGIDTVVVRQRSDRFYSSHDFYKKPNTLGCARLLEGTDLAVQPDNLVVLASAQDAGIQFGDLPLLLSAEYAAQNGSFRFSSPEFSADYQLVSVFLLDSGEGLDPLFSTANFESDTDWVSFVIEIKMRSVLQSALEIGAGDRFLTLACDYPQGGYAGCRLVAVARQLRAGEQLTSEQTAMVQNSMPLYPAAWYAAAGTSRNLNVELEADKWLQWLSNNGAVGQESQTERPGVGFDQIAVWMNGALVRSTPTDIVSRMVAEYAEGDELEPEAAKALAVACATELKRLYAEGNDYPEVMGRTPSEQTLQAVSQVIDLELRYQGELCWAPTFRCSSGQTNDASWLGLGNTYPYLQSVESAHDYNNWSTGYHRTTNLSEDTLRARLESYYDITLSGNASGWISVLSRTPVGYATTVSVDGQLEEDGYRFFVEVLLLPSANATVAKYGDNFAITTYGTGYGVGMSIVGAHQYALRQGWSFEQILNHYYTGVSLVSGGWDSYLQTP